MPDLPSFDRLKRQGKPHFNGQFCSFSDAVNADDVMHAIRSRQTFEGLFGDENNR
jgi:hypothetical protein